MAGGRGLKGHDRTPRENSRARRNAQRFAGDAGYLFSGALAVNDEGFIVLNLVTDGGLSQDATGLTIVVTAPIALDAGGVHLDYGTGLQVAAGVLKTKDTEIDHDNLLNFLAAEHIDWAVTGAEDVHVDRITAAAVTQHVASIDHDALLNFLAAEHFIQTVITNVSSALATGLLKVTTGTGALSVVADASADWNVAFGWGDHAGLYEPVDATLTSIAALGTAADRMLYTTNVDVWAETPITAAGRAILDDANAAAQADTLGLGAAQAVTHGSITVGTATIGALTGVLLAAAGVVGGGAALNNLADVNAGAPADNDSLTWDAGTNKWIPEAVGAGAGIGMNRVWMGC